MAVSYENQAKDIDFHLPMDETCLMAVSHENVLEVIDFHLSYLKPWLHGGVA
jgi:hypothetical protein